MPDPTITTKAELMGATKAAWETLSGFLDGLRDQQITGLLDREGWSVKDHLTHIARWEASVAVLFRGRPRHEGLGVDASLYAAADFDAIASASCSSPFISFPACPQRRMWSCP